jgi:AhpD family alkylhydroperoxidase
MDMTYSQMTRDVARSLGTLRRDVPDAMNAFNALSKSALQAGALSAVDKELIALAIGVSSRCDACIGFHVKALVRLGVSREQFMEALAVTVYMGGGPTAMYAANAVRAYEEFTAATLPAAS